MQDYDQAVLGERWTPGAIVAIQTYGDELNWHPHLHSLVSDAGWDPQGNSRPLGGADSEILARLFQENVLRMLVSERRLSREFARERRRNWARLLRKIYEVDPLTCPRCAGRMEIIAFVDTCEAIRKILQHLGRWELPSRSPPPRLFPHKEAFPASLTPQQAQRVRASTDSLFWDDLPVFEG